TNVPVLMSLAIASGDRRDHVPIKGIALVRTINGDPERLPAFFENDAAVVAHALPACLFTALWGICGRIANICKIDLARRSTVSLKRDAGNPCVGFVGGCFARWQRAVAAYDESEVALVPLAGGRDGRGFLHPALVVVEGRPADRRHGFRAGQRV